MARPGGNPDIVKYARQPAGEESLNVRISVKVSASMARALDGLENKSEFIRACIRRGLEES
jgi:hypothetical protein